MASRSSPACSTRMIRVWGRRSRRSLSSPGCKTTCRRAASEPPSGAGRRPTGLLRTWEAEERTHLAGTGLGARIDAYGSALRELRIRGLAGKDTDDGTPRLSFQGLAVRNRKWATAIGGGADHLRDTRQLSAQLPADRIFRHRLRRDSEDQERPHADRARRTVGQVGVQDRPHRHSNRESRRRPLGDHGRDCAGRHDAPGRLGTLSSYLDRYRVVTEETCASCMGVFSNP